MAVSTPPVLTGSTGVAEVPDGPATFVVVFPSIKLLQQIAQTPLGQARQIDKTVEELIGSQLGILAPRGHKILVRPVVDTTS